jgi:hypothetical protein
MLLLLMHSGYALYLDGVRMAILGSDGATFPDNQTAASFITTGGDPMQFGNGGIHLCIGKGLPDDGKAVMMGEHCLQKPLVVHNC